MSDAPRPKQHLATAGKLYAGAWRRVDQFRAEKGREVPDWPDWCFIPITATQAIVSADAGVEVSMLARVHPERLADPARLAALATWRVTQGIYRFDSTLYECVIDTPLERDLPCDVLYRLPEWCVYIETPDMTWVGSQLHGFWSHLEYDINTGRHELRFLLDSEAALSPLVIHLGNWSLLEAIERAHKVAVSHTLNAGPSPLVGNIDAPATSQEMARILAPLVSLLLYVCSQAAEIGTTDRQPGNPKPKRTKQGWRLFPADKPTTWDVGVRLGAALRRAQQDPDRAIGDGERAKPRAHVRRAHWHSFWKGPKAAERASERVKQVRWLPPIPVNVDETDDLPATVRPVKEQNHGPSTR